MVAVLVLFAVLAILAPAPLALRKVVDPRLARLGGFDDTFTRDLV